MSYEGYVQTICDNGHYSVRDDSHGAPDETCFECGSSKVVWANPVDDTNCESYGYIDKRLIDMFLKNEALTKRCDLGHMHLVKPPVYKTEGLDILKKFRMNTTGFTLSGENLEYAKELLPKITGKTVDFDFIVHCRQKDFV